MRVAALRVVGAAHDGEGRAVRLAGERHPEPLGVVRPAFGLADRAAAPLLQGDGGVPLLRADGAEEAPREERVRVGEETGYPLGLVEAVGLGRGGYDGVVLRCGREEKLG